MSVHRSVPISLVIIISYPDIKGRGVGGIFALQFKRNYIDFDSTANTHKETLAAWLCFWFVCVCMCVYVELNYYQFLLRLLHWAWACWRLFWEDTIWDCQSFHIFNPYFILLCASCQHGQNKICHSQISFAAPHFQQLIALHAGIWWTRQQHGSWNMEHQS